MVSFNNKILVLGATSWIGWHLLKQLGREREYWEVHASSRSDSLCQYDFCLWHRIGCADTLRSVLVKVQPVIIVNLLRGEDVTGFRINRAAAEWAADHGACLVYASSALALDGYKGVELTEDLPALGSSAYGRFKQKCERCLTEIASDSSLIVRFSSIHGWAPHKLTRSESFLQNMFKAQTVTVDRGVTQNRMFDQKLASAILDLIKGGVTGVVHLGSQDSSEELEFLQKVADAFGYDGRNLVVPGNQDRNVNLALTPKRILELYGAKYKVSERETIHGLLDCSSLIKYRKF